MYQRCKAYNIPCKQIGKLVVARENQRSYIEALHSKSLSLKPPKYSTHDVTPILSTKLLSKEETREMEPDLSEDIVASLWCPMTGIVDSHAFMESLEKDIQESEGAELVYATKVVRVDAYKKSGKVDIVPDTEAAEEGWVVQASSKGEGTSSVLARNLINASGLGSTMVLNSILPNEQRIPMYYARGSYASYHGPGLSNVNHLIYPCPQTRPNKHALESLGSHLTLDLHGKIRFGPDIEWLNPPNLESTGNEEDGDFWMKQLIPDDSRLQEMHEAVTSYLPKVILEGLQPDYCGVRTKLRPPGGGFHDFLIRKDYPSIEAEWNRSGAMISMLGIESPGLTASLAIAELVVEDILKKEKI